MTTVYDVLHTLAKYDGATNAHSMVISDCKKYAGKSVSMSEAWCSETVGAALAAAGGSALPWCDACECMLKLSEL